MRAGGYATRFIEMNRWNSQMRGPALLACALLGAMCATGCYYETNVTRVPEFRVGYQPNTTYELQQEVPALARRGSVYLLASPGQTGTDADGELVTIRKGTKIRMQ